jgi:hypothetical protein
MTHFIETVTKDGAILRIEVESTAKTGVGFTRQAEPTDVSSEAVKDAYDQALNAIRNWANGVIDTLQGMDPLPSAATIDFALKIDAEIGPMVAKSRDEGQFRISLSWKQPEPEKTEEEKS